MNKILEKTVKDTLLKNKIDWEYNDNAIIKEFEFQNFLEAFAFITQVALLSEKHNHHPYLVNNYKFVSIRLTTHDSGGVTNKDFELAKLINNLTF